MPLFRCTERLRRAMGLRPSDLVLEPPTATTVEWYANLFYVDHRKCLLFTHPPTLFSFLVPSVKKADLQNFGRIFQQYLASALAIEELEPSHCAPPLMSGPDAFAGSRDRSTLASMRDYQITVKDYVWRRGGWQNVDITKLVRILNDAPMGFRDRPDLEFPCVVVREWLVAAGVENVPPVKLEIRLDLPD